MHKKHILLQCVYDMIKLLYDSERQEELRLPQPAASCEWGKWLNLAFAWNAREFISSWEVISTTFHDL